MGLAKMTVQVSIEIVSASYMLECAHFHRIIAL